MINVNFLTTTDDNRKVSKNYTVNISNVACDIYDTCDLYNPTLIVKSNSVISSNYLYIPNFNRYYFIVNKNLDKAGITIINCECDVLMSFKSSILASTQMIIRSADTNNVNVAESLIVDNNRPVKPMILTENIQITGVDLVPDNQYILTVLGGNTGKFAVPVETNESGGNNVS